MTSPAVERGCRKFCGGLFFSFPLAIQTKEVYISDWLVRRRNDSYDWRIEKMNNESNTTYDVFISYRRSGGFEMAKLVSDALCKRGFKVFLDVEALRSGAFNTQLYNIIDSAQNFILILSPDSLERCVNEGDWVREEILRARQKDKNIVPVMLRGFSFPAQMPPGLDGLQFYNGINPSPEYFDAAMDKLAKMLKSSQDSGAEKKSPAKVIKGVVLVNGKPVEDQIIHAEKSNVEIKTNSRSLTVLFPKEVLVTTNSGNITIYAESASIEIKSNSSNISIFGDGLSVSVLSNNCNLHIYGDYSNVTVQNNSSNLYILGLHTDVNLMAGKAAVYGDYGVVNAFDGAQAEVAGEYKEVNNL
ncbi:MAG: toll/interleukin-1 receptor domain-containing protein [Lentisphaeria bacterium]|nr:toll/interleukin-1 receptor domain-containing protein [Lentisphaeria bacterium]